MIRKHVTKDGQTRWRARLGGHGEHRTFTTKEQARDWLDDDRRNKQRARAGLDVTQGPILFRDLADLYKENFQPSPWRLQMLQVSIDRWGDTYVREIRPEGIGSWVNTLTKADGSPYAEKSKLHTLETLRQVLNAGVEWGYLSRSPARPRTFKPPRDRRVRDIRPFESWSEVDAVASLCSPVAGALVRFAAATGLRCPGEVIDLDWKQVNRRDRELIVHGTKTDNAARTIPLSTQALAALDSLPRSLSGRVFVGKTGGRFDYQNWRKTEWPAALKAVELEHRTPYELRHTFATLALQAGAQIEDVSKVLGHSDISITLRYYRKWTRPMADRLRGVLDTIKKEDDVAKEDNEQG